MKWNMAFGMIVVVGSLAATDVRAQDDAAASATATSAQAATSDSNGYAKDFNEPATVDAEGVPVAKPNPMSDFLKRAREQGTTEVGMPLVSDYRTDDSTTGGQGN